MTHPLLSKTLQALFLSSSLLASAPTSAQLLNLSQVPAGSTAREPAPNIIVSVDDSGSMGWDLAGCQTMDFDPVTFGNVNDPARPAGLPACPTRLANTTPSRLADLRAALRATFGNPSTGNVGIVADGRIRLAWQALDDRNAALRPVGQQNNQDTLTPGQVNTLRPFTGAHRTNFDNFIASLRANSLEGTALHKMMANVHTYMQTTGINGPYANTPGAVSPSADLSCRKTFHILMTDGAWNSEGFASTLAGNVDGTFGRVLPDGTVYNNTDQTRLYADTSGGTTGTVADWAKRHWSTDYQALANNVRPLLRVTENQLIGARVNLTPYWNPRNNPMTWQGVTTYTIGFGASASTWTGSPTWDATTDNTFGGGFDTLVTGSATWQDLMPAAATNQRPMDLWHAALNGRGTFTPARTSADLTDAFQTILDDILVQTSRPLVSIATNSSRVSTNSAVYVAGYNSAANWSGSLAAFGLNSSTGLPNQSPTWRAEALLDARTNADMANRVVLTYNGAEGRSFDWVNLSSSQQDAIRGTDSVATGTARIAYLKGDRTLETAAGGMRVRSSRLGDIVNSNIWFTGRPTRMTIDLPGHSSFRTANAGRTPVLWVGGNDGMLHGFNATNGQEVLAYVPAGLYGTAANSPLRSLTQPNYSHRYYVDGSPFTGDVNVAQTGTPNWRTLLVGTLGAGGKGYFVLDVTNPASFVNPGNAASNVVLLDRTATNDADIGHIFAPPVVDELTLSRSEQIVRVNDSGTSRARWAVILGNGFNSTNQRPVLLVQYLDGDRQLLTIPVTGAGYAGQGNGLGAPRTVDLNGDGKVDMVYAGDLRGNLWKFDLTSPNPGLWRVSFSGNPLFTTSAPQPITTAPIWKVGPDGTGLQVLFGTGRNVTVADPGSTDVQTVYSLWDQSTFAASSGGGSATVTVTDGTRIGTGTSSLIQQTQNTAAPGAEFFTTSTNAVPYDRANPTGPRGWYFNLPVSRERVISNPMIFEGPVVRVNSVAPVSSVEGETCDFTSTRGTGLVSFFNIYSGRPPSTNVFGQTAGNRAFFGTGETASQRDLGNNRERLIDPSALCRGEDCPCVGNSCTPCVGPNCDLCGGLKGALLELCGRGLGGSRSDWREMR